ncbi:hypothetical protein RvY_01370 [Ramazzottius varieornatus]|uniref:E2F/DP family winged-helix DNA-binding domain-containing protein n=1 Tax=Ramazzottius varieornatus TaxID=947166 RepID=A0A1D1UH00_RAMVA|nr:hypothetical protein RvY_01370 [Ramazzottius varieornatus]
MNEITSSTPSTSITLAETVPEPVTSQSVSSSKTSEASSTTSIPSIAIKPNGTGVAFSLKPIAVTLPKTINVRPMMKAGPPKPGPTKVFSVSNATGVTTYKFPLTIAVPNGTKSVTLSPSSSNSAASTSGAKTMLKTTPAAPVAVPTLVSTTKKRSRSDGPMNAAAAANAASNGIVIKTEPGTEPANKRRRRTTEDGVKGLRYFATKVCDKVREKSLTTYNSVAEDLVLEYSDPNSLAKTREEIACEQKNIRRRVYDALNVLMAINVIQKERKQIRWVGLPRSLNEAGMAKKDHSHDRKKALMQLRQRMFHSSLQYIGLKELAEDNKQRRRKVFEKMAAEAKDEDSNMEVSNASLASELEDDESQRIHLPFLFLNCPQKSEVECSVGIDAKEYELLFSEPFKIVEDTEVLRHTSLVRALDKGEYGAPQVRKAVESLPSFMTSHFVILLNEHQERLKKLQEGKKKEQMTQAAVAATVQKQTQQRRVMENVLKSQTPIAPAPIKVEPVDSDASPGPRTAVLHPVVSVPNCAPIATLQTGSPVALKPAYYIQISKLGMAHVTTMPQPDTTT